MQTVRQMKVRKAAEMVDLELRQIGLTYEEFAALVDIPQSTFRLFLNNSLGNSALNRPRHSRGPRRKLLDSLLDFKGWSPECRKSLEVIRDFATVLHSTEAVAEAL